MCVMCVYGEKNMFEEFFRFFLCVCVNKGTYKYLVYIVKCV